MIFTKVPGVLISEKVHRDHGEDGRDEDQDDERRRDWHERCGQRAVTREDCLPQTAARCSTSNVSRFMRTS